MLKTQHPTDYLKKEEIAEPIEEKHYTQQGEGSFQPKSRVRRQYNPDDTNIAELFLAIRKHKTGNPQINKISEIAGLLSLIRNINDVDLNDNSNTLLHVAVSKGHQDIIQLLLEKQNIDINIKNNQGDTPLHIATSKDNKELVLLLLNKQAKIDIKNDEDKAPLDLAKNPEIIITLEKYYKSSLNERLFTKINVPADGSCLFWAAALACLTPVKYDDNVFKRRFERLFGSSNPTELKQVQDSIKAYDPTSNSVAIRNNEVLKKLVTEKFRNRIVDEVSSHQSRFEKSITIHDFLYSKNEDYVIGGTFQEKFWNAFSAEFSQYSVDINKLKPSTLNEATVQEIDSELDKIPDQNKVKKFKFETYLECMRDSRAWGGNHEIQAMSQVLHSNVVVFSDGTKHSISYDNSNDQVQLFNNGESHYNFGLVRAQTLIEAIKSNKQQEAKTYLSLGIDNINYKDSDDWTPLHFAAQYGNTEITQLLLAQGASTDVKNRLNQTPLDVARFCKRSNIVDILRGQSHVGSIGQSSVQQPQPKRTRTDSDENTLEDSSPKKPRVSSQVTAQVSIGVKRRYDEEEVSKAKKKTGQDYPKGGLVHNLHGDVYQLKLLMLFLKRGLNKGYSFRLATEWSAAESFDDLVLEYTEDNKKVYRFLQAKHKQDESKKISINDLITETYGEFSLQKYFISYRKIKQNLEFNGQNNELKDFIICTNIDLSDDLQNSFERVVDKDNILDADVQNSSKEPKHLNFKDNFSQKEELTVVLKDTSDFNRLAKKLAEHVLERKKMQLRDPLFKSYHGALEKEVINIKSKKFYDKFLNNQQLSDEVKTFREVFKKKIEKKGSSLQTIKYETLSLSYAFGRNAEHTNLPSDHIDDQEIRGFFEKLVFAVNQPNEIALSEIIKNELGKEFNNVDRKNVYSRFQEKMLDWMKEKKGRFILHEDGKAFFEEVKKEILGTVWFDVKDPVTLFTGRKEELINLHTTVQRNSKGTVVSQMTSISGLGGIGKSELVRKYAYDYEQYYDGNAIWVDAENPMTMERSFKKLARDNRLGIPTKDMDGKDKTIESIVKEIYGFFASRKSLFIFDNVEKSEDLNKFLPIRSLKPGTNKPYILITSRNREWEREIKVINLNELTLKDAKALVKKGLHIHQEDKLQDQGIKKLVVKLQRFPLAIQQAIAYIEDQRVTGEFEIDDYLKEYGKKTEYLLKSEVFREVDNDYTKTTFTIWQITIDKIRDDKEYGQLALDILYIIAYFAPKNINREIFLNLSNDNEEKLRSAVRLLVKYSMVDGEENQAILNVHRLVQEVIRINLKEENNEEKVVEQAFKLLEKNFPHGSNKQENFSKKRQLLPHCEAFLLHMDKWIKEKPKSKQVIEKNYLKNLLIWMGEGYCNLGNHKREKELLERALLILNECPVGYHIVAKTLANLGNAYRALGDYTKARTLLEKALPTLKEHHGPYHIQVAKTLANLGDVYRALRYYLEAKRLLEPALSIVKDYDYKNFKFADIAINLGIVYRKLDENEKAKELLEKALSILKKHYKYDRIKAAKLLENLAIVYGKLGDNKKAKRSLKEVLEIKQERYGYDHLEVAKTLQAISDVYGALNNPHEQNNYSARAKSIFKKYSSNSSTIQECLPSTSSGNRRKREAKECELSWDDVDEFNDEKDEIRDFSKIKINGDKFIDYIKSESMSEAKLAQLTQLADKVQVTGKFQDLVNKLTSNQKVMSHLNRVGRVSGIAMHGMMAKNVVADFLNGDYQGVAINLGFIAGGQGFARVAQAASIKGLELASGGKILLGRSLKAASPFLARGTSAFVAYDLVNQIKEYKKGNNDALVGIVGDSIYLGVDAAEIGIEIAEAFAVLEGVSSVTGPIGAAIGAVVFVGTDVYLAVKKVDEIDEIIHLTGWEKFKEGWRGFSGIQPEQYIKELMEEKQVNSQLVTQALEYLKQHSDIQRYVFPTGRSVIDSDRLQMDLDNKVLLDKKRTDIRWSRARPSDSGSGKFLCLPQGNYESVPSNGTYLCENAIGIEYINNRTGSNTLISLGDGDDVITGFSQGNHIVVLGNGNKNITLGDGNDTFLLEGKDTKGTIYGGNGTNTLDLEYFAQKEKSVQVRLSRAFGYIYHKQGNETPDILGIHGINDVLLRRDKQDTVYTACDTRYVDGRNGEDNNNTDNIIIPRDSNCSYEIKLVVRPYTNIKSYAINGNFTYIVPVTNRGEASISLTTHTNPQSNHRFVFSYTLYDINNIKKINNTVSFSFIQNVGNLRFAPKPINTDNTRYTTDYEFIITNNAANKALYKLSDNTEIKVGERNIYAIQSTEKPVNEIVNDYPTIANNLKMSIFVQSLLSNETVAVGHGNHDVLNNDPYYKSHLVGNGGENIFVVTSGYEVLDNNKLPIPEVVIYDLDKENLIDTLDLRQIKQQIEKDLDKEVKAKASISDTDLLIELLCFRENQAQESVVKVRLKKALVTNWYERLHVVVDNVPMKIEEFELKPLPLIFDESDKNIIVIGSKDIEEGNKVVMSKEIGNYTFVYNNDDLIITNAFDAKEDLCSITLSKFYTEPKMETLSIKFADKEIILKDHQEQVSAARDIDVVKKEHKDQVYNDVFNNTRSENISSEVNEAHHEIGHKHRHEHSRQTRQNATEHQRSRRAIKENPITSSNVSDDLEFFAAQNNATFVMGNDGTSSATRIGSKINDLFSWVKSSIGGLFNSRAALPENNTTQSSLAQVDVKVDVDGTIMLLDLLIRKVTGQKFISSENQSLSLLDAQGYTLNITEKFEQVLNETAVKSGISVTNLNFNPVPVSSAIAQHLRNGNFSEIAKTLYSSAKEACPEFKQTGKFLAQLKSHLAEVLAEKETVLLQQKVGQASHSGTSDRSISQLHIQEKAEPSEKPRIFLNGTAISKLSYNERAKA